MTDEQLKARLRYLFETGRYTEPEYALVREELTDRGIDPEWVLFPEEP